MDPIQPQTPEVAHRKSLGPIIALVVVIILLVIAALYFWGEKISTRNDATATTGTTETMLTNDEAMPPSNTSDEVSDLEAELQTSGSTDIDLTELESI